MGSCTTTVSPALQERESTTYAPADAPDIAPPEAATSASFTRTVAPSAHCGIRTCIVNEPLCSGATVSAIFPSKGYFVVCSTRTAPALGTVRTASDGPSRFTLIPPSLVTPYDSDGNSSNAIAPLDLQQRQYVV